MFERQPLHWILLGLFLAGGVGLCFARPDVLAGGWAGISTTAWLALTIAIPIVHHFYVWIIWRAELHHRWLSRRLGSETGFRVFAVGFSVLFAGRLVLLVALALANRNTLAVGQSAVVTLAVLLALPWAYTIYSVLRYFGLRRAFGIDHFDPTMRHAPFVRQGMFRFTNNAMYGPGFLIVWLPGLLWRSEAALLAGAFNHAYIWVHYFTTELPDIRRIYGSTSNETKHAA